MKNLDTNIGNDDDKTIVYSSDKESAKNANAEAAVVSNDAEKTQVTRSPVNKTKETPASEVAAPSIEKSGISSNKAKENKVSAGVFAAGVAGAGIAGAALGTEFSDEIKELFHVHATDTPAASDTSAHEVTPDLNNGNEASTNLSNSPIEHQEVSSDGIHSFDVSATDNAGNTYAVSLLDLDGDGKFDFETGNFHFVDGSSISYIQSGDSASLFASEPAHLAEPQDYQELPGFYVENGIGNPMLAEPNTHIYEIQAGDTLSEIAAANHTSIEHLMELNPDITNADQIYARHQLIIPDNDHISNPYETGGDFDNQMVNFIDSPISDEPIGEESAGDYDSVDWASFSDDYPGIDDSAYGQALAQTDFDNYHANNSLFESGNDSVSSEFI